MVETSKSISRQGWDIEVSNYDLDIMRRSLVRKLLDNGKFWLLCIVIIVVGTIGLVRYSKVANNASHVENNAVSTEVADYNDSAHQEFIKSLLNAKSLQGIVNSIEFSSSSVVSITVPANINNDDIAYAADYIGARVLKEFNSRIVIEIYTHNYITDMVRLIANANWNERRHGYSLKIIEPNNL